MRIASSHPMEGLAENQLDALKRSLVDLHHVHHFQILSFGGGCGVVRGDNILRSRLAAWSMGV